MEQIVDFLDAVGQEHKAFAEELHNFFLKTGCKDKIEKKASGYCVSYAHPKTKRSIFNFYFRKNGLHVRLYPEKYPDKAILTDRMVSEIDKAPDCKRLTKTADCNPKCAAGYDFKLQDKRYQKCRLCTFQFLVTAETKPVIRKWIFEELV